MSKARPIPATVLNAHRNTHTSFDARYDTPGKAFCTTEVQLHARRCRNTTDEAQLEIKLAHYFRDTQRSREMYASMSLEPQHARQLALAIAPEFKNVVYALQAICDSGVALSDELTDVMVKALQLVKEA
jgi:hypothetical protein